MKKEPKASGTQSATTASRPDWDDYWLSFAECAKARSTDNTCQVGAVIVRKNVLVSAGYNGFARSVSHQQARLVKSEDDPEKLRWMCHAEENAIYNAARVGVSVEGGHIYTTKFPCLRCAHAIIQAGIQRIVTADSKPYDDALMKDDGRRVEQVLLEAGIQLAMPNCGTSILSDQFRAEPDAA